MVIVAKMKALNGKEADMEQLLRDIVDKVRQEPGTLTYTLHKDLGNPGIFLFYEKYADMDAVTAHSSTDYFKALFASLKPLIDGKPEISMYTQLASIS